MKNALLILVSCLALFAQAQHDRGYSNGQGGPNQGPRRPPAQRPSDASAEYADFTKDLVKKVIDLSGASRGQNAQQIRNLQAELARCSDYRSSQYFIDCARKNSFEILDLALSVASTTKCQAYIKDKSTGLWNGDGQNYATDPATGKECPQLEVGTRLSFVVPDPIPGINAYQGSRYTMYRVTVVAGTCQGAVGYLHAHNFVKTCP